MTNPHGRTAHWPAVLSVLAVLISWSTPASASHEPGAIAAATKAASFSGQALRPVLPNDQGIMGPDRTSNVLHTPGSIDSKLPQTRRYRASAKV